MYLDDGLNSLMIQTLLIQTDSIPAIPSMALFMHVFLFTLVAIPFVNAAVALGFPGLNF